MKLIILNVPDDFDTGLVGHQLPRDTLYSIKDIPEQDLISDDKLIAVGKYLGVAMARAFRKKVGLKP